MITTKKIGRPKNSSRKRPIGDLTVNDFRRYFRLECESWSKKNPMPKAQIYWKRSVEGRVKGAKAGYIIGRQCFVSIFGTKCIPAMYVAYILYFNKFPEYEIRPRNGLSSYYHPSNIMEIDLAMNLEMTPEHSPSGPCGNLLK
jgi:hypothetical protein